MSGARGFVAGVVGLSLLEVVTTNRHGEAGRVGDLADAVAAVLAWWLNPYTPLVPDLTGDEPNPFGADPDLNPNGVRVGKDGKIHINVPEPKPKKLKPGKGGRVPGNPDGPGITPGPGGISS